MSPLTNLPNIGAKLAIELQNAAINTPEKLRALGSIEAAIRISSGKPHTGYNMLYALEGAIRGIRWHDIAREELYQLRIEYDKRVALK